MLPKKRLTNPALMSKQKTADVSADDQMQESNESVKQILFLILFINSIGTFHILYNTLVDHFSSQPRSEPLFLAINKRQNANVGFKIL